jgi:hypothetical protein
MFVTIFVIVLVVLLVVVAAMSIGVLAGRKPIQGSCGGLGSATGSSCSMCSNRENCTEAQKAVQAQCSEE